MNMNRQGTEGLRPGAGHPGTEINWESLMAGRPWNLNFSVARPSICSQPRSPSLLRYAENNLLSNPPDLDLRIDVLGLIWCAFQLGLEFSIATTVGSKLKRVRNRLPCKPEYRISRLARFYWPQSNRAARSSLCRDELVGYF